MVVELLTNLQARVKAVNIAKAYKKRWTIENAFQDLVKYWQQKSIRWVIPRQMIEQSLRIVHKSKLEATQRLSRYKLALEIKTTTPGMEIAIESPIWERTFGKLSTKEFANWLLAMAKRTDVKDHLPYKWFPIPPETGLGLPCVRR